MKELYAVLLHVVIDDNTPQRASVISTTDEGEYCAYHTVTECGVGDAWLICEALQFHSNAKYQKLLDECEYIAQQITQDNLKAIKTELKNIQ